MICKALFVLGIFFLVEKAYSAPCNCGLGSGINVCSAGGGVGSLNGLSGLSASLVSGAGSGAVPSDAISDGSGGSSCYPLVVRPQILPVIDLSTLSNPTVVYQTVEGRSVPLKPIGDLCSCGQTIIKPAVVPRPSCAFCSVNSGSGSGSGSSSTSGSQFAQSGFASSASSASSGAQIGGVAGPPGSNLNFLQCGLPVVPSQGASIPYAPVDAVSQAIAQQALQNQRNDKVESQIQFGFQSIPQEVRSSQKAKIPEGNLQSVNGPILELKPQGAYQSLDDEALADLQEPDNDDDEPDNSNPLQLPSYSDYGYGLANDQSGQFTNVAGQVQQTQNTCGQSEIIPLCQDGYRGGQVIIKEGPVSSQILPVVSYSPPCTADEEQGYYDVPSYASYSASSSSASSSSNSAQNVFFRSLNCS